MQWSERAGAACGPIGIGLNPWLRWPGFLTARGVIGTNPDEFILVPYVIGFGYTELGT